MKCTKLQLCRLLILAVVIQCARSVIRCDSNLLSTLKLRGVKHSIRDQMHICPMVHEKCCTLTDEIRIVQLWNQYGTNTIKRFSSKLIRLFEQLVKLEPHYQRLKVTDIVANYVVFSRLSYIHKTCSLTSQIESRSIYDDIQDLDQMVPGRGPVRRIGGNEQYKLLSKVITQMWLYDLTHARDRHAKIYIPVHILVVSRLRTTRKARKALLAKFYDPVRHFEIAQKKLRQQLKTQSPRKLSIIDSNKGVKSVGKKKIQPETTHRLPKEINPEKDLNPTKKGRRKLNASAVAAMANMALKATPLGAFVKINPKQVEMMGKLAGSALKHGVGFAKQLFAKRQRSEAPSVSTPVVTPVAQSIQSIRSTPTKEIPIIKRNPMRIRQIVSSVYTMVRSERSYLETVPTSKKRRIFIPKEKFRPQICCQSTPKYFMKPLIFVNEHKFQYCKEAIRTMKRSNVSDLLGSLSLMRSSLVSLLDLKKTLYCSACDAHYHKFYDFTRGVAVYTQDFCLDLLVTYRDYIIFKNIILIDFLDKMLQVKSCIKSDGGEMEFPFVTQISWHKRRIPFIKRCYENIESEDFFKYCRFICMQYKMTGFSNFFEGDLSLLTSVYSELVSFLRQKFANDTEMMAEIGKITIHKNKTKQKQAQKEKKTIEAELSKRNQAAIKKPSSSKKRTKTVRKTSGVSQKRKKVKEDEDLGFFDPDVDEQQEFRQPIIPVDLPEVVGENFIHHEIFEKIRKPYNLECLRPFFSSHKRALNPIQMVNMINFNYNMTSLVAEQARRTRNEPLTRDTVKTYFAFGHKGMSSFNSDTDLTIDNILKSKYYADTPFLPYDPEKLEPLPPAEEMEKQEEMATEPEPLFQWMHLYANNTNHNDELGEALHMMFHKK